LYAVVGEVGEEVVNGETSALPIVFAGYGIQAPAEGSFSEYNSYRQMDPALVKDRWVMVFRYLPEGLSGEEKIRLSRFSTLEYKAAVARDLGAKGMIVVSGPNSGAKEELIALSLGRGAQTSGFFAISMSDLFAERLLQGSGLNLKGLQDSLDAGEWLRPFELPGAGLSAVVQLQEVRSQGRNVIARLKSQSSTSDESVRSSVLIGAHIDHLGHGETGTSLSPDPSGAHLGADDNASGASGVLEIAQKMANLKERGLLDLKKDVLFALWSGEELGTRGSQFFVEQWKSVHGGNAYPTLSAVLNMDMIGRYREQVFIQGTGSSHYWKGALEMWGPNSGLRIFEQEDPYLPTDSTPFYLSGVPVLAAFTGTHPQYHTPQDVPALIHWDGLRMTASLMERILSSLAQNSEAPDYVKVARSDSGNKSGFRATLGVMPDYSAEGVRGLKIVGVRPGGPAEKAGLQSGDVIIQLAAKKIENIQDYMFALNIVKIREPNLIVVMRNGERIELSVVPESKE
jgi:hypothetical protein